MIKQINRLFVVSLVIVLVSLASPAHAQTAPPPPPLATCSDTTGFLRNSDLEAHTCVTGTRNFGAAITNWDNVPAGTAEAFIHDAPTCVSTAETNWQAALNVTPTTLLPFSGNVYAGLHNDGPFQRELVIQNLDTPLPAGVSTTMSFATAMADFTGSTIASVGMLRNPSAWQVYGIRAGAAYAAPTGAERCSPESNTNVDLLGETAVISSQDEWVGASISFTTTADYDRIIFAPKCGAGSFLLFDCFSLSTVGTDYGDAPVSYGSVAHTITAGLHLGDIAPDAENAPPVSADATGDDAIGGDEDGITIPTLTQGQTATITADVTGAGGFLQGWIDFDGSGTFDAGEQVATNIGDETGDDIDGITGSITFDVTVPSDAVTTPTFARFRWSTAEDLDATSAAPDGEVEDYAVTIAEGAAPVIPIPPTTCGNLMTAEFNGTFGTLTSGFRDLQSPVSGYSFAGANNNGAGQYSVISQPASVGFHSSSIIWDNVVGFTTGNTDDAYLAINGSTQEGVFFEQSIALTKDEAYQVSAFAMNAIIGQPAGSSGEAELGVRLVRESDGQVIQTASSGLLQSIPVGARSQSDWTQIVMDITAPTTDTYRLEVFNISTQSSGNDFAIDQISVAPLSESGCPADFSDAPISTLGGARHSIVPDFFLGAGVTSENADFDSANADGDVDDGITIPTLTQGQTATITAEVTGAGGFLQGWIDFNGSGTFDAGEQVATNIGDETGDDVDGITGSITFEVTVPSDATTDQTFARFRWSTVEDLDATTAALDGEVEDYAVTIAVGFTPPTNLPLGTCLGWNAATGAFPGGNSATLTAGTYFNSSLLTSEAGGDFSDYVPLMPAGRLGINQPQRQFTLAEPVTEIYMGLLNVDFFSQTYTDQDGNPIFVSIVDDNGNAVVSGNVLQDNNPASFSNGNSVDGVFLLSSPTPFSEINVEYTLLPGASGGTDGHVFSFMLPSDCDNSDAPATFDEASHAIVSGFQLGATIDADTTSLASPNADGDVDDGITIPTLTQGETATITAEVTGTGGFLQGWIDFDGSGTFEVGEQVATNLQDDATDGATADDGTITFDVAVPVTATTTQTFARFRWSSTVDLDATTAALDGEVEDYAVTIVDPRTPLTPFVCTGDLHQVHSANGQLSRVDLATSDFVNLGTGSGGSIGPAGYRVSDNLFYGLRRIGSGNFDTLVAIGGDGEVAVLGPVDGLPAGSYNAGDFAGDGYLHVRQTGSTDGPIYRIDVDERRVVSSYTPSMVFPASFADFAYSPADDLIYTVPTGSDGLYSIRPDTGETERVVTIDASNTGFGAMFADASGNFLAQDNPSGNVYLIDTETGISTFVGRGVGGLSSNDGFFCQAATVTLGTDFSDAPGGNDTSHTIIPGVFLGAAVDADPAAQPNADATGDDDDEGNDDDGITIPALTQGETATITADVTGAGGFLQGWIDFDGSGTFEAGEQVATNLQDDDTDGATADDGTITFDVTVPVTATTTQTFARFRWSTVEDLDATTAALDGEVEDYAVTIVDPRAALPAFTCTGEFFQVHGNGNSRLSRVDLLTGTFSPISTNIGASLRGTGLNAADGLAYGIQDQNPLPGNVLFAVGADGSSVNLGTVTDLDPNNHPSGDFGPDGLFYIRENGNNNRLIAIDVDTRTVVRRHAPSGITNPNTADFAFNPVDQSFYAVQSSVGNAQLLRFEITSDTTMSVTSVGSTGIQTNGNGGNNVFGAMYADSDGNVFGIQNSTGRLFQFSTVDGSAVLVGSGAIGSQNDGLSCSQAVTVIPRDFGDAPTGGTVANGITANYGAASQARDPGNLYIGTQPPTAEENNVNASDNADGDENEGATLVNAFQGTTTYAATVSVLNNTGGEAFLCGFIDAGANGFNGTFEADERSACETVPNNNAEQDVELEWAGLDIGTNPATYLRLRLATVLSEAEAPTGEGASIGEVEDYLVPTEAVAIITGIVFDDANFNTEFDAGDTELSGITISAFLAGPDGEFASEDDVLVASGETGGPYTLILPQAGDYNIRLDKNDPDIPSGLRPNIASAFRITVALGDVIEDLDFALAAQTIAVPQIPQSSLEMGVCEAQDNWRQLLYNTAGQVSVAGLTTSLSPTLADFDVNATETRNFDDSEHTPFNPLIGFNTVTFSRNFLDNNDVDEVFTQSFSGREVYEVLVHVNSFDHVGFEFLQSQNPGIGWEILSASDDGQNISNAPDLFFVDTREGDVDRNAGDERRGGDASRSADGTIRLYSLTGDPIDQLIWHIREDPVNIGRNDGTQMTFEACIPLDFSDAPTTGTSLGQASHGFNEDIRLGADISPDPAAFDSADASDDAFDDGITFPTLTQGQTATLTADVIGTGGFLQGWVDFNGDGDFDDAGEQIATDLQDDGAGDDAAANDGTITLDVAVPENATLAQTFARFRWSTEDDLDATGAAPDGEVEDYAVTFNQQILSAIPPTCSVPIPFDLRAITNAASQTNISLGRVLGDTTLTSNSGNGSIRSGDINGNLELFQQNSGANFDAYRLEFDEPIQIVLSQADPVGTQFNNGESWTIEATGGTLSVTDPGSELSRIPGASPGNPQRELGNLTGDGTSRVNFSPTNTGNNIPVNQSNWQIVSTPVTAIELSLGDGPSPANSNASPIRISFCGTDHGDAPGFPDASHGVQDGISLGATVDVEGAGQSSPDADGDDNLGPESNDEDGVTIPTLTQGLTATITAEVTGAGGFLQGWIDFNGDGDFDDAGEQVATDMQDGAAGDTNAASGLIGFTVSVPSDATLAETFARFRWSTTSGLGVSGSAPDGEVEDYAVTIEPGTIPISGTVFLDNGTGAGATPHDGLIQGDEPGEGAVTVEAVDALTGDLVNTVQTNADGTYTLELPITQDGRETIIRIAPPTATFLIANVSGFPVTEVAPAGGVFTLTPAAGIVRAGLDFGLAGEPRLTEDQIRTVAAGSAVTLPHTFTASSPVDVTFTLEDITQSVEGSFTAVLFEDTDCDQAIGAADTIITGQRTLAADQAVCLIVRVSAAAGTPSQADIRYTLRAEGTYTNSTVAFTRDNADRVSIADDSGLTLTKSVCNATTDTCDLATGTGFSPANTGAPGDRLIYRIGFEAASTEPVTDLVIFDRTPAFSALSATLPSIDPQTTALSCALTVPATPVAGYEGSLEWRCTGDLPPGSSGIASFEIIIAQ